MTLLRRLAAGEVNVGKEVVVVFFTLYRNSERIWAISGLQNEAQDGHESANEQKRISSLFAS